MKYWVQCHVLYTRSLWRKEKLRSWERGENNCGGKVKDLTFNPTGRVRNDLHGEWKDTVSIFQSSAAWKQTVMETQSVTQDTHGGGWETPWGVCVGGALLPDLEAQRQGSTLTAGRAVEPAGRDPCPAPSQALHFPSPPAQPWRLLFSFMATVYFIIIFFGAGMKSFYFVSKYKRVWLDLATKKKK